MAMVPGLMPNLRLPGPEGAPEQDPVDVIIEMIKGGEDIPEIDERGNVLQIEHADGSISVSIDGNPIDKVGAKDEEGRYFE